MHCKEVKEKIYIIAALHSPPARTEGCKPFTENKNVPHSEIWRQVRSTKLTTEIIPLPGFCWSFCKSAYQVLYQPVAFPKDNNQSNSLHLLWIGYWNVAQHCPSWNRRVWVGRNSKNKIGKLALGKQLSSGTFLFNFYQNITKLNL